MTTLLDIAKGLDSTQALVQIFGRRSTIGTSEHDVSGTSEATGGNTDVTASLPTAAAVVSIVSDSANDAAAGTGARSVRVYGLDSNFDAVEAVVALNGLTPALSTQTFSRVNDLVVEDAGSGRTNAGTVLLSLSAAVLAALLPGTSRAQAARYTVPRNRYAYLLRASARSGGTQVATARFFARGPSSTAARHAFLEHQGAGLNVVEEMRAPLVFAPKTDLWVRALTASSTAWVSAGMDLLLVNTGE